MPPRKKSENIDLVIPDYFKLELGKNNKALHAFDKFPPSHKKEYVQWIIEAKSDETRKRRMDKAIELIAEAKGKNWEYERK